MTELARRLPRDMEGFFERFLNDPFAAGWTSGGRSDDIASWTPTVDVVEEADTYVFQADLPGVPKENVEITFEDNILTIAGSRERREETGNGQYRRIERRYGRFTRSFALPSQVDPGKVDARFQDGVLVIRVPKAETAKARKIKIA
jgi:HSP20 family protein